MATSNDTFEIMSDTQLALALGVVGGLVFGLAVVLSRAFRELGLLALPTGLGYLFYRAGGVGGLVQMARSKTPAVRLFALGLAAGFLAGTVGATMLAREMKKAGQPQM